TSAPTAPETPAATYSDVPSLAPSRPYWTKIRSLHETGGTSAELEITIESMISITRTTQRNVKRWKDAAMAHRWTAAGMLVAQAKFRRIKGYKEMPLLLAALTRHTAALQPKTVGASA
ncbi:MAG: hypothetical protein LC749_08995, partial [Actinobacteria bacterium]|nr:hypothetical protein [Actinomycetota bacterium]